MALLLSLLVEGATCLAASGDVVAVGGHGGVVLIVDGKRVALGDEKRNCFALAFAGDRLVEAGGRAGEPGEVRCWAWKERKLLWKVAEHRDVAYSIAVAGGRVFTGGADKVIAVLDLETGKTKSYLEGHAGPVLALAASPDGKTLASGSADRSIRIWEVEGLKLARAIHNHSDAVHALAWSPDGRHLASGSADRSVRVWQPGIGRLVRIVRGHDAAIHALAWTDKHIVSGATDGKVRLIDPSSDAIEQSLDRHRDWVVGVAAKNGEVVSVDWAGDIKGL